MIKNIGFIGCGNMGSALLMGCLEANIVSANDVFVYDVNIENCTKIKEKYDVQVCETLMEVYCKSSIIVLATKPQQYEEVIAQLIPSYDADKIMVSIAAGITLNKMQNMFAQVQVKVARVMPNTPSLVGMGASGVSFSSSMNTIEKDAILEIFNAVGSIEEVAEEQMDAVVATSGSSPAYIFMFIEAMIDSAIKLGLDPLVARKLAAQSVKGAAEMVLTSEISAGQLKENVCSPGGTTIEAVQVLSKHNLHEIVEEAMQACANKSRKMSQ